MRTVTVLIDNKPLKRQLPEATKEVIPNVRWGEPWEIFSASYWLCLAWMKKLEQNNLQLKSTNNSLEEEIVFCLLGGFGITAELATAYFKLAVSNNLIKNKIDNPSDWEHLLRTPIELNGKPTKYRFPVQKARYLAGAMSWLENNHVSMESGISLREQLLRIPGIGYKTASWITRNFLGSENVAILDIHLIRAGILCGMYSFKDKVEKDYLTMEEKYLTFSNELGLNPALLDFLIWDEMRKLGSLPIKLLREQKHVHLH